MPRQSPDLDKGLGDVAQLSIPGRTRNLVKLARNFGARIGLTTFLRWAALAACRTKLRWSPNNPQQIILWASDLIRMRSHCARFTEILRLPRTSLRLRPLSPAASPRLPPVPRCFGCSLRKEVNGDLRERHNPAVLPPAVHSDDPREKSSSWTDTELRLAAIDEKWLDSAMKKKLDYLQ